LIILYKDLKTYGKDFYDFSLRAKSHGVKYIKGKLADVYEIPQTKNLIVTFEDLETGSINTVEIDLLVLSVPVVPSNINSRLIKALKLEVDEHSKFFKEPDPINNPLGTNIPGIYLCGGSTGPIDISESVTQAIAACMKVIVSIRSQTKKNGQNIENSNTQPPGVT